MTSTLARGDAMKMKMEGDKVYLADVDSYQYSIMKSWGLTRYDKTNHLIEGPATGELLNKIAQLVKLPESIEAERIRLNKIQDAVDAERLRDEPTHLYDYPVKVPLFKHQEKACSMTLLTFGLIDPEMVLKE